MPQLRNSNKHGLQRSNTLENQTLKKDERWLMSKQIRTARRSGLILFMLIAGGCSSTLTMNDTPVGSTTPGHSENTAQATETSTSAEASPSAAGTSSTGSLPAGLNLDPDDWKSWPVMPILTANLPDIYQLGQELGNNAHALSIFGDCQSKPEVFLGIFETDPDAYASLPEELQQTVDQFMGSFNRPSPTVKDATTAGGLLWPEWHAGMFGCMVSETPVDCELRIHQPSFVIINVGTHWVTRNQQYLRTIIQQLVDHGVVPILATKVDDRYQGEQTNHDLAVLAVEFSIPLWNFWAAALEFPDHGVYSKEGQWGLGDVYLSDQALELYRLSGLQALDLVWRAATGR